MANMASPSDEEIRAQLLKVFSRCPCKNDADLRDFVDMVMASKTQMPFWQGDRETVDMQVRQLHIGDPSSWERFRAVETDERLLALDPVQITPVPQSGHPRVFPFDDASIQPQSAGGKVRAWEELEGNPGFCI